MPKLPIDHSNTIIYKLVHKEDYDNVNIYIGSTTDFIRRKNKHKSDCNCVTSKSYNQKNYQYIRDNGGWEEWNMIEVEKFPCNDKREAEAREEYWRCHFNAQLNTRRPYITVEERKEQIKEYKEHNKGKLLEQQKEYRENDKDKLLEQQKEYRENNKDKLLIQQKERITCECGIISNKSNLTRHHKTQRHLLLTKQIKYEFVDDNGEN